MSSPVSVCNMALGWLGQKPIVSLNEDKNSAILCNSNYPSARDATLEAGNWSFAMKYVNATYDPAYTTPAGLLSTLIATDCLRVHRVFASGGNETADFPWYRQGNFIVSESSDISYKYIARIEDTNAWLPSFLISVAAHLAALIAIPLTENAALGDSMWNLYYAKLKEARSSDGMQGSNEIFRNNRLTGIRRI